jgi:nitroreductase
MPLKHNGMPKKRLELIRQECAVQPGRTLMELYDVMRTTFAAREFSDDPLPDTTLFKILDNARFAPSGGNRQGWRVIVVRDHKTREALVALTIPAAKRYAAQQQAGENPWNTIDPTSVDAVTIEQTPVPARLTESLRQAAVVLVVCVDLKVVASTDQNLERIGVISGASIYPFVWNILLSARHEGYGGTITTLAVAQEPQLQELLGIPQHVAVCAIMPLGKPLRQPTKLSRKAVPAFATLERWDGEPLTGEE